MNIPSYKDKTFIVEDNKSFIRENDLTSTDKIIPKGTEVIITDTKVDDERNIFVFAQAAVENPEIPSGWTKGANLEGGFVNELVSYSPDEWELLPQGNNFTVVI